ncbi:hypothetical protein Gotur_021766 [Gossypium turneri]
MHVCEDGCETLKHVFQDCVTTKEVWGKLEIRRLQNLSTVEYSEWMTYLLENGTGRQRSLIIGAIRAIWTSRNRVLHERHNQPVQEILEMRLLMLDLIKIYFDRFFQRSTKESCSRLVVRRPDGTVDSKWVEIEGDALTIIKKANINRRDESVINASIEDIRKLNEFFHTYHFSYTARERNGLTHILEIEVLKREEQMYLLREVSSFDRGGGNLNQLVKHSGKIRLKGYLGENNDQFFEKLK